MNDQESKDWVNQSKYTEPADEALPEENEVYTKYFRGIGVIHSVKNLDKHADDSYNQIPVVDKHGIRYELLLTDDEVESGLARACKNYEDLLKEPSLLRTIGRILCLCD